MSKSRRFAMASTTTLLSAALILPIAAAPATAAPTSSKPAGPSVSKSYPGENTKRGYRGHNREGSYNYKSPAGYTMPQLTKCISAVEDDAKGNEDVEGLVAVNPDTNVAARVGVTTASSTTSSSKKAKPKSASGSKKAPATTSTKSEAEEDADRDKAIGIQDNNASIIANSEQADNLRSVVDVFTTPRYSSDFIGGASGVSSAKKVSIEDREFFTSQVVLALLTKDPKKRQAILNQMPANIASDVAQVLSSISVTDIIQMVTYFARTGMDAAKLAAAIAKIQSGEVKAAAMDTTREVLNLTADTLNMSAQSVYMLNKFFQLWNNLKVLPSLKDVYRILDPSTDAGAMFYCSIPKEYAKSQTFVKSLASLGEVARVGAMTDASYLSGYLSDLAGLVENLKVSLGVDTETRGSTLDFSELLKNGTSLGGSALSGAQTKGLEDASGVLKDSTDTAKDSEDEITSMGSKLGGGTSDTLSGADFIGSKANLADATQDTIFIILNSFDAINVVYSLILPIADASVNAFVNIALLNMPGNNDLPGIGKQINAATPQFDAALEPIVKQLGLKPAKEVREERAEMEKADGTTAKKASATTSKKPAASKKATSTAVPAKKKAKTPKKSVTPKKAVKTDAWGSSDAATDKSAVKSLTAISSRSAKLAESQGKLNGDDKLMKLSDQFKAYRSAVKQGKSTAGIFES